MLSRRWLAVLLVALLVAGGVSAVYGAQQAALDEEEQYATTQLRNASCLDDWGTDTGTATKRATVTGVTAVGLRVRVQLPYAYRTQTEDGEPLFADTSSTAVYGVTVTGTRRLRGDRISPCPG